MFKEERINLATTFKIINLFFYTVFSLILGYKLAHVPTLELFVIVYFLGFLFLFIYSKFKGTSPLFELYSVTIDKLRLRLYLIRASLTAVGMISWIESLKSIGIAEASVIAYATPFVTIAFAIIIFKEKIQMSWLIPFGLCLTALYIMNPEHHFSFHAYGSIMALLSSFAWGLYDIVCKRQTVLEDKFHQTMITFLFSSLLILPFALSNFYIPNLSEILYLSSASFVAILSVTALFISYSLAPLTKLMPHSYLRLVFAVSASFLIEGVLPENRVFWASLLILSANVIMIMLHKTKNSIIKASV